MDYLPITKSALSNVGDLPFDADLVGAEYMNDLEFKYKDLARVVVKAYCRIAAHERSKEVDLSYLGALAVDAITKSVEVLHASPPSRRVVSSVHLRRVKRPEVEPLQPKSSWAKSSNEIHEELVASGIDPYAPVKDDAPVILLPAPPPGQQWHRDDWNPGDLTSKSLKHPADYRPLLLDEREQPEDEYKSSDSGEWISSSSLTGFERVRKHWNHRRTRRPLKFNFSGKEWTWYSGKGPILKVAGSSIWLLYRDGSCSLASYAPEDVNTSGVIGWRFDEDPLHGFKKAHREGKTVQFCGGGAWSNLPINYSFWDFPPSHYRVIEHPMPEDGEENEILPSNYRSLDLPPSSGPDDDMDMDDAESEHPDEPEPEPDSVSFLREWEKWVAETATYFDCGGGDITYPLLGLVGELGELVNSIVKYYRKADLITLKISDLPVDLRKKLKDESYDALHFLMFLLNEQGITLEEIINYGKEKLEKRMEEGTVHQENRAANSIVGKIVYLAGVNTEAYVSKESIHTVTVKTTNWIDDPNIIKGIEVSGAHVVKDKSFRYLHAIARDKFYSLLK